MTLPNKLSLRLTLSAALWVLLSLLAAGLMIENVFRGHVREDFDRLLIDHLEEVSAVTVSNGQVRVTWPPLDEKFADATSGWYWQIQSDGRPIQSSGSLGEHVLSLPPSAATMDGADIPGYDGRRLRLWSQRLKGEFPQGSTLVAAVAAPLDEMAPDIAKFNVTVLLTMTVLFCGLTAAAALQIRAGLSPLRRLGQALTDIRTGKSRRLPERFPDEVLPVVHELNVLLDFNQAWIEKARGQAADLAHSLKNPLSVIRNDARALRGPEADRLRRNVESIIATVENHLARSRNAGTLNILNASTAVGEVAENLKYSFDLLYRQRNLTINLSGLDLLQFRGDPQDLEELLGALLDNACKFAHRTVLLAGRLAGDRLILSVVDDGPGMPLEARRQSPERGRRLDSTKPGTGLGLSIASDLAHLYGGSLDLQESAGGGLTVVINLPALS